MEVLSATAARVTWKFPESPCNDSFQIESLRAASNASNGCSFGSQSGYPYASSGTSQYTFTSLHPNVSYTFTVYGHNPDEDSDTYIPTVPVNAQTHTAGKHACSDDVV